MGYNIIKPQPLCPGLQMGDKGDHGIKQTAFFPAMPIPLEGIPGLYGIIFTIVVTNAMLSLP